MDWHTDLFVLYESLVESEDPMSEATMSPEEDARQAAIARVSRAIKNYMKRKKMSPREFTVEVLGIAPGNTAVYSWLSGRGLPSSRYVSALSKALKVGPGFFLPHPVPPGVARDLHDALDGRPGDTLEDTLEGAAGVTGGTWITEVAPLPPEEPDAVDKAVATFGGTRIVYARNPQEIMRERAQAAMAAMRESVEDAPGNSLTYWTNDDGTATVTCCYTADRAAVMRAFLTLSELGVDAPKKMEPDIV